MIGKTTPVPLNVATQLRSLHSARDNEITPTGHWLLISKGHVNHHKRSPCSASLCAPHQLTAGLFSFLVCSLTSRLDSHFLG